MWVWIGHCACVWVWIGCGLGEQTMRGGLLPDWKRGGWLDRAAALHPGLQKQSLPHLCPRPAAPVQPGDLRRLTLPAAPSRLPAPPAARPVLPPAEQWASPPRRWSRGSSGPGSLLARSSRLRGHVRVFIGWQACFAVGLGVLDGCVGGWMWRPRGQRLRGSQRRGAAQVGAAAASAGCCRRRLLPLLLQGGRAPSGVSDGHSMPHWLGCSARGPETLRVFSNWLVMRVIMPRAEMKDSRDSTCR